mmetsp:Transcript_24354/g.43201  ORF Transcript_24354/g.43201 Transcript_24354/m.43201 type:complete len:221 (-) Transcript_24354:162-824(-)|eukprot:CAMPEP_0197527396 /NCGR_PEP_ID=MMETSP1318-20131121/21428_1 /TAXON_ID=552666 /ORGANISM="Partenskyella glossopodia, Strain RCC365" /LENGTH=220 /DNA_ID=CAMNT_0043082013 /DNA_START=116 /DNA_END=778 /DNA_ORIENTATION=-
MNQRDRRGDSELHGYGDDGNRDGIGSSDSGSSGVGEGSTLSNSERQILLKSRRKIWLDGMLGMAIGSSLGAGVGFGYNKFFPKRARNPGMVMTNCTLIGLAFGGFVFSTTAAKNTIPSSVAAINQRRQKDVQNRGFQEKDIPVGFTRYQTNLARATMQTRNNKHDGEEHASSGLLSSASSSRRSSRSRLRSSRDQQGNSGYSSYDSENSTAEDVDYDMRE